MGNVAQSRPLGPLEHNMTYGDQVSRLNFCTLARISGPLRPEYVEAGLRELQARHPLMRSEMEDRSGRPHFVERVTAPIPLEVLEDVGEAEWTPLVEERLQRFIDPTQGPLLRCTLIRHRAGDDGSWTLALLFHHAIGDAISGAYSTRDLLEAVGRHAAMAGGDSPGRPARPALPLPTNVEAHIPEPIRAKGLWRQFWAAMGWILGWVLRHGRPLGPRLDRKRVRLAARRVVMAPEVLAAGETRALAERSKAEGTTVHGAIGAAILLAVQEDHGKRGPQLLGSPVNLRDRLTPSVGEDVGLFVSMGASLHSIDPERDAFWDLARSVGTTS